ncbi:hypothetical protein [Micromonospora sp. NPDC002717]|uniref:hypothetical protein n=1 Tax=Micromonospora sp. NPDC002717 TaxID=3154424 RepID=UPI0033174A06
MKDWLVTASGAVAIVGLLYLFYAAVRTRWPESYVSASTDVGLIINRNITRYLAFMFGPAYIITLIVSTTVDRFGGKGVISALAGALIHVGRTQGVHYFKHVARNGNHTRLPATIVAIVAALGTLASAGLGGLGPGPFTAVVPPIDEFFKSLWTTIFVALLAVAVLRASKDTTSAAVLAERSKREVGEDLLRFAREEAEKAGVDPILLEGILLTENLQRPKWVRRLERWKGWLRPEGTYGVMQVHSAVPLSDRSSVLRAISDHLSNVVVRRGQWTYYDREDLRRTLSQYNSNEDFVEVACEIVEEISHSAVADSGRRDGRTREEQLAERVNLALAVWKEMAMRMAAGEEGVVAIARLPISDLRTIAEIVERLPKPSSAAEEDAKVSVLAALEGSGLEGGTGDRD